MLAQLNKLQQWLLYTPLGRHTLANERRFYHRASKNIFGYNAIQLCHSQVNFLYGNKITQHYILNDSINCDIHALPFASNSIDLIICPHVLEFSPYYIKILEECQRVLIPEGKLLLTCFSQHSLFKLFAPKDTILRDAKMLSLSTLKQQLLGLSFRIDGGSFLGYRPPINNARTLAKLSILDKIGNRWFPTLANSFALALRKEVISNTRITPLPQIDKQSLSPSWRIARTRLCKNS